MANKVQAKSVRINCLISEKLVQLRMPIELYNRLQKAVKVLGDKTQHQVIRYAIRERAGRGNLFEFLENDARKKNITMSAVVFMSLSMYLYKLGIE